MQSRDEMARWFSGHAGVAPITKEVMGLATAISRAQDMMRLHGPGSDYARRDSAHAIVLITCPQVLIIV